MFDIGAIPGGWELAARATGETGRVAKGISAFVRQRGLIWPEACCRAGLPSLCEKHLGQVLQLSGIKRNQPCRVGDSGLHAEVESTLSRWSSSSQWLEAYWSGWSGWSSSNWADSCFATGHFLVTGMLVLSRNSAKKKFQLSLSLALGCHCFTIFLVFTSSLPCFKYLENALIKDKLNQFQFHQSVSAYF